MVRGEIIVVVLEFVRNGRWIWGAVIQVDAEKGMII